ncbi:MAG: LysR family transcriptional regulator, partial [Eubacteriales bacterium]
MEIRQLIYFVTAVEEKTVTAAAEKLHMTQPPLTMQL